MTLNLYEQHLVAYKQKENQQEMYCAELLGYWVLAADQTIFWPFGE